ETTIDFPKGRHVEGTVSRGSEAVSGATVIFHRDGFRSSTSATSDASGHYAVDDLDDGEYAVSVMHLSSGQSHETKVTITADRTFDISLPTLRLAGTVNDATTGKPLEGASVSLDPDGRPAGGGGGGMMMMRNQSTTDATGAFHFDGVADGTFTLSA